MDDAAVEAVLEHEPHEPSQFPGVTCPACLAILFKGERSKDD
jgi:hypothetical protein